MKLTAIFLLAACMAASATGLSQKVTLNVKDVPLEKVFAQIKKQTGLSFIWDENTLKQSHPVTIKLENAGIEEALNICMEGQPLMYSILQNLVVIKLKKNLPAEKAMLPPVDVKGKITNEEGEPVRATITVKGTAIAVAANDNGEFELKGIDENATLIITGVNIETREVKLNGKTTLAIRIKTVATPLDAVVVNKGYYTTSQRLNTGNVSKVTYKDIEKQPVSNPLIALQGRMAGVRVIQNTGVPGGGVDIRIRGRNSIRDNGNAALYVIDGVPVPADPFTNGSTGGTIIPAGNPFNILNPSDIESIEVLKDADATAIYGSRGANGVILITTKKGKSGKTKVDVNVSQGFGKVPHFMDLLNTEQYLQMRNEAFANDGMAPQSWNAPDLLEWDTTRYTDWQKKLIGGTANFTNMQLSVSGGTQNTQFLIGGGYDNQTTVFPGNYSNRKITSHLQLNHIAENKKLAINLSGNYVANRSNLLRRDLTRYITLAPVAPEVYDADGNINWVNATWANPYAELFNPYEGKTNNMVVNALVKYDFLNGLVFKTNLGYNNRLTDEYSALAIKSQPPDYSPTGTALFAKNQLKSWVIEPQAEYNKKIGQLTFNALVGTTFQKNEQVIQLISGYSYKDDALLRSILAAGSTLVTDNNTVYKYNAIYGRLGLNYKEKYLLNLTARRDGSSRFGPGKQFANFGAAGIGWIFSQENFIAQSLPFISYGKIRASYGTTGSDQIPNYGFLNTFSVTRYPYQNVTGFTPARLNNPDYAWEENRKLETAIELGFLKNRILLSVSWYRNRSSNQLVGFPLSGVTGFTSLPYFNLPATVQNTGWEIDIHTVNIRSKELEWTSSLNISIEDNKLVSYPNIASSDYANTYVVGQSLYKRKRLHFTGVDPQTGLYQYEDVNHDGLYNLTDRQALKKVTAAFFGGLQNSIRSKRVQLDFMLQFVKQNGSNYINSATAMPGMLGNQPTVVLSRWRKPGDITSVQQFSANYGTLATSAYQRGAYGDDLTISDASYIRLQNLSLLYQLPTRLLQSLKITDAAVFFRGQNLFTITNYIGLDPETQNNQVLPPLRVLSFGIKATF